MTPATRSTAFRWALSMALSRAISMRLFVMEAIPSARTLSCPAVTAGIIITLIKITRKKGKRLISSPLKNHSSVVASSVNLNRL
jgi:tartrate dehydratase alpha subunit/fumarate hydratase class I-like protein